MDLWTRTEIETQKVTHFQTMMAMDLAMRTPMVTHFPISLATSFPMLTGLLRAIGFETAI